MLDFEEELKKFQPSLTDLLRAVIEQTKQDDPQ